MIAVEKKVKLHLDVFTLVIGTVSLLYLQINGFWISLLESNLLQKKKPHNFLNQEASLDSGYLVILTMVHQV